MLFNPLTNANLRDDSKNSVRELFDQRYRVRRVREGFRSGLYGSTYYVDLEDGHTMKVQVDKKPACSAARKPSSNPSSNNPQPRRRREYSRRCFVVEKELSGE